MLTPRQIELIEVAIELTSKEGIQALTIRNVSAQVGISEAAVYRHFESKQSLLKSVLLYLGELLNPLFEELITTDTKPQRALATFLTRLFRLIEQNNAFTLTLYAEETFNVEPALKEDLLHLMTTNLGRLAQFFTHAARLGQCRTDVSADQLALITFGTIRLSVSTWRLNDLTHSLSEEGNQLIKVFETLFSLT
ncbi:MAG: TetR/AcrR family transcriptional regulator [Sphaerochaetaceae bacterium]